MKMHLSYYIGELEASEVSPEQLALKVVCEHEEPRSGAHLLHQIDRSPQQESVPSGRSKEVRLAQLDLLKLKRKT